MKTHWLLQIFDQMSILNQQRQNGMVGPRSVYEHDEDILKWVLPLASSKVRLSHTKYVCADVGALVGL